MATNRWQRPHTPSLLTWSNTMALEIYDYHIFGLCRDFFKKNFRVAAYIVVRLMCGCFQKTKHYTLHATACLDQHLITISSPTVLHNHWLSLQPCGHPSPARRVSLSLCLCMCGVSFQRQSTALHYVAAVYCTHRQSTGKLPPEVPCWARSSGPQAPKWQ